MIRSHFKALLYRCAAALLAAALISLLPADGLLSLRSEAAAEWPSVDKEAVTAGNAIVMDADSGAILWGREIHEQCFPASITKLMTALIVLENCSLDEEVVFSESAVTNLESGAVTAYTSPGDVLTVKDCLYAALFKSANEVCNALAEHVAGSTEAFAELMNRRAEELGCRETHFANANGLTNSEHLTSAYDMALIGIACMNNEQFLEIEKDDSHKLAPTEQMPGGLTVSPGHKMLKDGTAYSDERVVGGKTGYTKASGNTLVTMAESNGRRLVAVVMNDKNPQHYQDTKLMLDFGFSGFENVSFDQLLTDGEIERQLVESGAIPENGNNLSVERSVTATVPLGGQAEDLSFSLNVYSAEDGSSADGTGAGEEANAAGADEAVAGAASGNDAASGTGGNAGADQAEGASSANADDGLDASEHTEAGDIDILSGAASDESLNKERTAELLFSYGDHTAGRTVIYNERESQLDVTSVDGTDNNGNNGAHVSHLPEVPVDLLLKLILGAAVASIIVISIVMFIVRMQSEKRRRKEAHERRRQRLESINMSEEEFEKYLGEYREDRKGHIESSDK